MSEVEHISSIISRVMEKLRKEQYEKGNQAHPVDTGRIQPLLESSSDSH